MRNEEFKASELTTRGNAVGNTVANKDGPEWGALSIRVQSLVI
jgi:hypothetical protein